jgi:hypothetical protein
MAETAESAGIDEEFLESKRLQYGYFKRIIFSTSLAVLIGTFGVIWVIS